ncbi:transcription termination factor MTERF8, chloroplastic-like [Carex rostrata]
MVGAESAIHSFHFLSQLRCAVQCTSRFSTRSAYQVTMPLNLFLGTMRIHCLRPSLPLNRCTPLAASKSPTQASPTNPHFSLQYLVQSCGLSSDEALKASKHITHLKSPDNPDAVLRFLRETGVNEVDIRTAVLRDPPLLCCRVDNSLRPNIEKLQELGFSKEDISAIIARTRSLLVINMVEKLDFWLGVLGSVENLSLILIRYGSVLTANLEKVVVPNLSFLQNQCGLSLDQILQLIKYYPCVFKYNPEKLKIKEKMVEELGIERSSGMFVHVLGVFVWMKEQTLVARLNNLKRLGLSEEEVVCAIIKAPSLLRVPEELIARKMKYLIEEVGFDRIHVVQNPAMLMHSLENRLIPRNVVRNLLRSKGLPAANRSFSYVMTLNEKLFVERFVRPYEHIIPNLHRAYAEAGKIRGVD